jgi:hypothetical protein
MVLPVRIWGMDKQDKPFNQLGWTLDVSYTGARLVGFAKALKGPGEIIGIQNGNQKARFRVAWIGGEGTAREGQIAVRALETETNIWGLAPERRKLDRYRASEKEATSAIDIRELASDLDNINLDLQAVEDALRNTDLVDVRLTSYFRLIAAHLRAVNGALEQWLKLQGEHADPFIALTNLQAARIRHATEMIKELLHDVESGETDFSSEEMTALTRAVEALAKYLSRMFRS